jgi:hypothetical protein
MSKRFGQVNVGALIGQGVRNYWAAPVVSTLAYLPYEWYAHTIRWNTSASFLTQMATT